MVKATAVVEEKQQGNQMKPMKLIENKRGRRVSYMKRKDCIMKKTMELSTLCGIKACTICLGPNGEVETWPENQTQVRDVINMCKQYGMDKDKKIIPQSFDCLDDGKVAEEIFCLGFSDGLINGLSTESLEEFSRALESKSEALNNRIGFLTRVNEENTDVGEFHPLPTMDPCPALSEYPLSTMDPCPELSEYPLPIMDPYPELSEYPLPIMDPYPELCDPYWYPLPAMEYGPLANE